MPIRRTASNSRFHTWLLLAIFLIQFMLLFNPDALAWDGVFYYATARSLLFDGDLHLANDLQLSYAVTPADFAAARFEQEFTATGYVDSPFAIGTSLLWLPWFALVRAGTRLAGLVPDALTGYEWYFRWTIAAVASVYGWLALLATHRLMQRVFDGRTALATTLTAMMGVPLVYYEFREPFYGHTASAMVVAFLVAVWWPHTDTDHPIDQTSALLLGALTGVATLVRTQNMLFLALPLGTILTPAWTMLRTHAWRAAFRQITTAALCAVSAFLVASPQFAAWQVIYGRPFLVPQGPDFMDWRAPWVGLVLFSPLRGLLAWMPFTLPALIGLLIGARIHSSRWLPLLAAFLLQVYANSSVNQWFGGGGYGARRFSDTLAVLALGYAVLLSRRSRRWRYLAAVALGGLLVLHQWLILRYGFGDHIGGEFVETATGWAWEADTWPEFLRQLVSYLPSLLGAPLQALRWPASPLDPSIVRSGPRCIQAHLLLVVLLITHLALGVGRHAVQCFRTRDWVRALSVRLSVVAAIGLAILLADCWLLGLL